jgi:glyoxylase-like metal-dependent hydrolase (beta-lactamase superfamily II)
MTSSWFQTRQLNTPVSVGQTWAIDDNGNNIIYLLTGRERALLLDTGWGVGDLPALVASFTDLPLTVVNTHGHPDHVGGNGQFAQVAIADADRQMALGCLNAETRRWAMEFNALPQPFPPDFNVQAWMDSTTELTSIAAGEILDLGERQVEVIALPGHSPGSICLLDRANRWIFTGDSLLPWAIWMHLDESLPLGEFLIHLRRLKGYAGDFDAIWPSHGKLAGLELPAKLLDDMITGIEDILAGRRVGTPERTFAGDGLRCNFNLCGVLYRPDRL